MSLIPNRCSRQGTLLRITTVLHKTQSLWWKITRLVLELLNAISQFLPSWTVRARSEEISAASFWSSRFLLVLLYPGNPHGNFNWTLYLIYKGRLLSFCCPCIGISHCVPFLLPFRMYVNLEWRGGGGTFLYDKVPKVFLISWLQPVLYIFV